MAIHVENNVFTLHTNNSTYQMKADEHRVLLHTYYGARIDDTDCSWLFRFNDRGFCGNIPGTEDGRTYSLDYLPQEFPVYGDGDYRVDCMKADMGSGVNDCLLLFDGYEVRKGKYALEGLPAMFSTGESKGETLEIILKDIEKELYVHLLYGVFEEYDMITRTVRLENRSADSIRFSRLMSACVDFNRSDLEILHFYGKHAGEQQVERSRLVHGITELRSTRGTSSHQHNPFVILAEPGTTEMYGACYGFSLLYSGGFHMQAELDQFGQTRLVLGIDDYDFSWQLAAGETFAAPEVCMTFSIKGLTQLSQLQHRAFQTNLIRSRWKDKVRPIIVNNWEATYFDFNKDKILEIAKEAVNLNLDMIVLDDGWFGKRDSDYTALGDWYENEEKLGGTLAELVEEVHKTGLSFGLWFEPEMVSEDSALYREHPDWAMEIPGREPVRGRSQLVLDMSREDVTDYLLERICDIVDRTKIEYIKWDMNRSLMAAYSAKLPRERQGEVRHRYVLGLYRLLEAVVERYPELLLEGCSGGGGRFDAGMLYYCPQIWCSDNTDAIERLRIQYGTSFGYPMSSISAHVSTCPNHQNGRVTPFKTRGICAMQGTFGYELNLSEMTPEEKEAAKKQIAFFKAHSHLFQFGRYYRLASPFENKDYTAWEFVDREQKEACVAVVFTDLYSNPGSCLIQLKGLAPDRMYRLLEDGEYIGSFSGIALMNAGILLPVPKENYDSCQFLLQGIDT